MVSPARRRDAVSYLVRKHGVSERRACSVCDQYRSTQRYRPISSEFEQKLCKRMNELASRHPRYGYRRVWALLRSEGFPVNRKRIERLWRLEGHRVPPRRIKESGKRAQGGSQNAAWNLPAASPNHIWSYDFMNARTQKGSLIRILNVVDEYTRVALGCRVASSIGALDVIQELEGLFHRHGKPKLMRSDNGREFISQTLVSWLRSQGVEPVFIERGSPQQNPYVERFNGTMRDEKLSGEEFASVLEARVVLEAWLEEYNSLRPHRGLGMRTPLEYAKDCRKGSK
jgi:transposase InsO family protein